MRHLVALLAVWSVACGATVVTDDSGDNQDGGRGPALDAGTDGGETCAPATMRTVPCGNCGLAQQVCGADSRWNDPGQCLAEGECAVAAVETQNTDRCGMRSRICDDLCHWRDWTVIVPDGECVGGEVTRLPSAACTVSEVFERHCSSTCRLDVGACVDACGGARRTDPPLAEEMCIPAGPFMRGSSLFADAQPVAEVQLSAFYIDRYPVTNDRFRDCVVAGVCTPPEGGAGLDSYNDSTRGTYAIQALTLPQAIAFCAWDGGRTLPTEAQWEKSARGPSPRSVEYPWGDAFVCPYVNCARRADLMPWAVDAHPETASYYGVEQMAGGGVQYTRDWYDPAFYGHPESLVIDPVNTVVAPTIAGRGLLAGDASIAYASLFSVAARTQLSTSFGPREVTLRCSRSAP